jgi:hypothetical protein
MANLIPLLEQLRRLLQNNNSSQFEVGSSLIGTEIVEEESEKKSGNHTIESVKNTQNCQNIDASFDFLDKENDANQNNISRKKRKSLPGASPKLGKKRLSLPGASPKVGKKSLSLPGASPKVGKKRLSLQLANSESTPIKRNRSLFSSADFIEAIQAKIIPENAGIEFFGAKATINKKGQIVDNIMAEKFYDVDSYAKRVAADAGRKLPPKKNLLEHFQVGLSSLSSIANSLSTKRSSSALDSPLISQESSSWKRKKNMRADRCVVCLTGFMQHNPQHASILGALSELGLSISENVNEDTTHLVVATDDNNRCTRTLKYIKALSYGKWITNANCKDRFQV